MAEIAYFEKDLKEDPEGQCSDLPIDIEGERLNYNAAGIIPGTPSLGRYKGWTDSVAITAGLVGASWIGVLDDAVTRWGIARDNLVKRGTVQFVKEGEPPTNIGKLQIIMADGSVKLVTNPES